MEYKYIPLKTFWLTKKGQIVVETLSLQFDYISDYKTIVIAFHYPAVSAATWITLI